MENFVIGTLTGSQERDASLSCEVKALIASVADSKAVARGAEVVRLWDRLEAERKRLRDELVPLRTLGSLEAWTKKLEQLRGVVRLSADLKKSLPDDPGVLAELRKLASSAEERRARAQELVRFLADFETADVQLRDILATYEGELRTEFGITEQFPRSPAGAVTARDAAATRSRVAELVTSLEGLLARTTDPGLRATFGGLVNKLKVRFGLVTPNA